MLPKNLENVEASLDMTNFIIQDSKQEYSDLDFAHFLDDISCQEHPLSFFDDDLSHTPKLPQRELDHGYSSRLTRFSANLIKEQLCHVQDNKEYFTKLIFSSVMNSSSGFLAENLSKVYGCKSLNVPCSLKTSKVLSFNSEPIEYSGGDTRSLPSEKN